MKYYVYFIRAGNRGAIKIGIARNIQRRLDALQVGNQYKLNLIASIPCVSRKHAEGMESKIHRFFRRQNIRGEWFQGNINLKKIENLNASR